MKIALITGITGQDGSFLAEFLLERGMKFMALSAVRRRLTRVVSNIFIWMNGFAI